MDAIPDQQILGLPQLKYPLVELMSDFLMAMWNTPNCQTYGITIGIAIGEVQLQRKSELPFKILAKQTVQITWRGIFPAPFFF